MSFAVVQIYISKGDIKKDIITGAIFGAVDALAIEAGEKLWGVSDEIEWTNVIEGAVIGGVSGGISNKIGNFAKVTQRLKSWGKSAAIKIGGFVDKIKAKIAKITQRLKSWGKSAAIKIGDFVDKIKAKIVRFIYSREKYFSDKTKFEWFVEATIGSLTSLFINYLWQKTKEKKEEAIKTIERSYTEAIYQLSKKTEDIILSDMHFFK